MSNTVVTDASPTCPTWCDLGDLFPGDHTQCSDTSEEIELTLPPLFRQRDPYTRGHVLVPAVVAVTLVQEGFEEPRIDLERNEKWIASLTLDEAGALVIWLTQLVVAARHNSPVPA